MALFDTWKWFQGSKMGDGWKTPDYAPGSAGDPMGETAIPANLPMAMGKPPVNNREKAIMQTSQGDANQQHLDWLGRLTGVNMDKAKKQWENKGGFEGLMANPAFTMGLAFMQAGAEGKTLGAGAMDNVMKAAGISSNYKRLMEAKAGGVKEVTTGQMDKIKDVLQTKGIDKPGFWRTWRSGGQSESYEQAVEDIAFKVQAKVDAMVKSAKASGKDIEVGNRLYKKVIDDMIASGEIQKKGGVKVGGYQVIDATLEARSRGGPITKGKSYLVGEEGPEVVIPRESAKVLSNDDSKIYAMLLAANPQLQKVSRARSEKILRNRFPEYFE
tara:strand:+ start:2675 stop:3658 length:984 start_codon:yes stop_codon:yes gene_type:complete